MITWMKYDKNNPPELDKEYLVSDGEGVGIAVLDGIDKDVRWFPNDSSKVKHYRITHYAIMNLPTDIE